MARPNKYETHVAPLPDLHIPDYLRREFYSIIYKVRKDVWRAGVTAVCLYQTNRERDRKPSGDHEKITIPAPVCKVKCDKI